jgi:hypothetical protein
MTRRIIVALASALSVMGIVLMPAVAHAATRHTVAAHRADISRANSPRVSGYYYDSVAGYGKIWDDTSTQFKTSHSHETPLNELTDTCNNSGYCEIQVPNGDCMQWDSNNNEVNQAGCNLNVASQRWGLYKVGSHFAFLNDYADTKLSCAGGYDAAVTSNSSGADIYLKCPDAGTGKYGNNQLFSMSAA